MNEEMISRVKRENEYGTKEYFKTSLCDMVNSVYYYNEYDYINKYLNNKYIQDYYLDKSYCNGVGRLSKEETEAIVISQVAYLKKYARITRNVYTDSEGVSYNSLDFIKESEEY